MRNIETNTMGAAPLILSALWLDSMEISHDIFHDQLTPIKHIYSYYESFCNAFKPPQYVLTSAPSVSTARSRIIKALGRANYDRTYSVYLNL